MKIDRLFKLLPVLTAIAVIAAGTSVHAAKKTEPPPAPAQAVVVVAPAYDRSIVLRSMMNPHEQINDEGEVLWGTCTICHTEVPDIKKQTPLKDLPMRYSEDGLSAICQRCHQTPKHPGAEGVGVSMSGFTAPDHLTVPSSGVALNMRMIVKDIQTILPLDPKNGKIICSTCHNPHERGLLAGRADYGADHSFRLRSAGLDICQYCHRK